MTPALQTGRIYPQESNIYAVVETGGKQYKVSPGQTVRVNRLPVQVGAQVELDRVLLVSQEDRVTSGAPLVAGAKVVATAVSHGRGEKVMVLKYKAKTRYRRKRGHRQPYTQLAIQDIILAGQKG